MSTIAQATAAGIPRTTTTTRAKPAPATAAELDSTALLLGSDNITSVRLDGLALTKIVKHSRDAHSHSATGTLLGLDIDGCLEVSNVFPLPAHAISDRKNEEEEGGEEKGGKSAAKYTSQMIRLLRSVNADANPVGLYHGCFLGSFLSSSIIDGLTAVTGLMETQGTSSKGKGVLIVHDLAQSAQGNTVVKAYKLSPAFIEAHGAGKLTTQSLIDHKLTFSNILIEIPITLRNTALLDALLSTLNTPVAPAQTLFPPSTADLLSSPPTSLLQPSYGSLTLAHTPVLSSALDATLDALDEHASEAGNVGYQARQLARERARAEAYLARRKAENAAREAQGLPPMPIEDVAKLFKLPAEPSRLESLLVLGKLDDTARRLAETSAVAVVQLNAARTGAE